MAIYRQAAYFMMDNFGVGILYRAKNDWKTVLFMQVYRVRRGLALLLLEAAVD